MGRLLGIDPGQRWVGIALTDEARLIPTPRQVVDREAEDLSEVLKGLLDKHEVDQILVGYPRPFRAESNERTRQVDEFVERFVQPLEVPCSKISERFTTKEAKRLARERGSELDRPDAGAAALIINHFLKEETRDKNEGT